VENPGASRPDPSRVADKVAYTGIAIYSPEILGFLPAGVSHATVAWVAASKAGFKVRAMDVTGAYWNDVGDPATYARGVLDALRDSGEMVYRSTGARCGKVEIDGYVVLESGSQIRDGARIRNCILMPGADASGDHENSIIGPDYVISLSESDMQPSVHAADKKRVPLEDPLFARHFRTRAGAGRGPTQAPGSPVWSDAILVGLGGSDRRYFRVRNDGWTAILMECRPEDPDFDRHLAYTRFFAQYTVPVPALLTEDSANKRALFEDLGDTSLYAYLKLPRDHESIENMYPLLQARVFDYDYLRWETTYFLDRFVTGLRKVEVEHRAAVDEALHRLAQGVFAKPKVIIHRDFQCQNIMVHAGGPRIIDYQGARLAPPAYDIASVLWDPYHRLDDGLRERLLAYYVDEMKGDRARAFDEKAFVDSLVACRLQRHMQALGAYGFLSEVKGKKYFLKHVPEALRLLKEDVAAARQEYPELARLIAAF
jgi:aminoglycoside/choline kinase family phosphotransferase